MLRYIKTVFGTALIACLSGTGSLAVEPGAPEKLMSRMDAIGIKIHQALAAKFKARNLSSKQDQGTLVEFYTERNDKPLWVNENGLNKKAKLLMAELARAANYELDPKDYKVTFATEFSTDMDSPADWLAKADLKLSYAALKYARHANGGRITPAKLSKYIDRHPQLKDPVKFMRDLAENDNVGAQLVKLHPTHPQFKLLIAALRKARTAKPVDQIMIPEGPTMKLGLRDERVPTLRDRLDVSVESSDEDFDPEVFDEDLADAVMDFQKSKGLKEDGIVGNNTIKALNWKPSDRTRTLMVNLERWRWMPRELGKFHIRVNVPEYKYKVIRNGKVFYSDRAIVGKITNQTPVFSDEMETVVFNPYWYPTQNIIRNEILPGVRRNDRFIYKNGFEVVNARGNPVDPGSIDWYNAGPRDFSIRQPPGSGNALGEVKFLFPNKHAVYLHDTPQKKLFDTSVRMYSHGCMRIRNPRRLAEIVMSNEGWKNSLVHERMDYRENQHFALKNKIPVHVTYFTAWVNDDGTVRYHNDIYKHDKRIYAAFHGLPVPRDPVDPVAVRARQLEREISEGFRRRRSEGPSFTFQNIFGF